MVISSDYDLDLINSDSLQATTTSSSTKKIRRALTSIVETSWSAATCLFNNAVAIYSSNGLDEEAAEEEIGSNALELTPVDDVKLQERQRQQWELRQRQRQRLVTATSINEEFHDCQSFPDNRHNQEEEDSGETLQRGNNINQHNMLSEKGRLNNIGKCNGIVLDETLLTQRLEIALRSQQTLEKIQSIVEDADSLYQQQRQRLKQKQQQQANNERVVDNEAQTTEVSDANVVAGEDGSEPIHVLELLDRDGLTPLHRACLSGSPIPVVLYLIQKHPPALHRTVYFMGKWPEFLPIHVFLLCYDMTETYNNNNNQLELLRQINPSNNQQHDLVGVLKCMIEYGGGSAFISKAVNLSQSTPLHYAIKGLMNSSTSVFQNSTLHNNISSSSIREKKGAKLSLIKYLVQVAPNAVNVCDQSAHTPLDLAMDFLVKLQQSAKEQQSTTTAKESHDQGLLLRSVLLVLLQHCSDHDRVEKVQTYLERNEMQEVALSNPDDWVVIENDAVYSQQRHSTLPNSSLMEEAAAPSTNLLSSNYDHEHNGNSLRDDFQNAREFKSKEEESNCQNQLHEHDFHQIYPKYTTMQDSNPYAALFPALVE